MKTALFTVSYAGFWGQARLSLPDVFRKAKALGYDAVEVMGKRPHMSVVDCTLDDVRSYRALLDELGLQVASVASYTNFTGGMESREVPFVEIQLSYIQKLAQYAEILGADLIRVFTGYNVEALTYDQQWNLCVQAVQEACDLAAQYGVRIGVQNHHDIGVGVEAYEDFLDQVGRTNCCAVFDAWSIVQHGSDLYTWAKRMAPRMAQTTVADYIVQPRYHLEGALSSYVQLPNYMRAVPVGKGFIPYADFMRGLREGGFDGYVCYEMCSPVVGGGGLENLDATARMSREAIERLIAGEG